MPFVSDKQRKYLYANEPDVARKFATDTKGDPMPHKLPGRGQRAATNKSKAYAKALRAGSQSPMGTKKTGTTGSAAVGGAG